MGGTTPEASLAAIQARLSRTPEKALKLFYRLAGLREEPTEPLPYLLEDLEWGLTALQSLRAAPEACARAFAVLGIKDPLVDETDAGFSDAWKAIIRIDATHHYDTLIKALPSELHS
jgi:hypothetical protein